MPAFEKFELPKSKGDGALLQTAHELLEKASRTRDILIRHAMPPDFIDVLTKNIKQVEEARHSRSAVREAHRDATAVIDKSFKTAMSELARLDVLMDNRLRDRAGTLRVWKAARHVTYPKRKKAAAAEQSDLR